MHGLGVWIQVFAPQGDVWGGEGGGKDVSWTVTLVELTGLHLTGGGPNALLFTVNAEGTTSTGVAAVLFTVELWRELNRFLVDDVSMFLNFLVGHKASENKSVWIV
jgi:hypothetical protein